MQLHVLKTVTDFYSIEIYITFFHYIFTSLLCFNETYFTIISQISNKIIPYLIGLCKQRLVHKSKKLDISYILIHCRKIIECVSNIKHLGTTYMQAKWEKILEKNIEAQNCKLGVNKSTNHWKIEKLNHIKIKNSCSSKDTIRELRGKPQNGRCWLRHICDKGLYPDSIKTPGNH